VEKILDEKNIRIHDLARSKRTPMHMERRGKNIDVVESLNSYVQWKVKTEPYDL
jgi:hypothetical protein